MNGVRDEKLLKAVAAFEKLLQDAARNKAFGKFGVIVDVEAGRVTRFVVKIEESKK